MRLLKKNFIKLLIKIKINDNKKKKIMEDAGIDPAASRMLNERSTI